MGGPRSIMIPGSKLPDHDYNVMTQNLQPDCLCLNPSTPALPDVAFVPGAMYLTSLCLSFLFYKTDNDTISEGV